jgi:glycosyltransferase involved in cell wall biosynthesis
MSKRTKKILILCPSPKGTAATQRLKYEQYLDRLEKNGYSFTISAFQTRRFWAIIHKPGHTPEKVFWVFVGYLRRIVDLIRSPFYDAVFVNLWVTPLGPPIFENLLLKMNKRVIFDIDDMIFMNKYEHVKLNFYQRLKGNKKPLVLMKHARFVIVCTPKLEEMALERNKYKKVVDISSTFNTERFLPVTTYQKSDPTVIGWTGTHSSLPFLYSLQPVLANVSQQRNIKLIVIANKEYKMEGVPTEFIPWKEETEVQDLHRFEIGLYPIPANEYSLGKSSLKALTYMAIAIPVVATAYGTNFRVMQNGVQGFLVSTPDEWVQAIINLVDDVELRKRMGKEGRKTVEQLFSIQTNIGKYLQAFDDVTGMPDSHSYQDGNNKLEIPQPQPDN